MTIAGGSPKLESSSDPRTVRGGSLMGAQLAKIVSTRWAGLPGREFKVLNRMALTALDHSSPKGRPASVYFGGWEALAQALNRDVPDDTGEPETDRIRQNLVTEVTRITTSLVRRGALKQPVDKARRGHQQSWVLTL
jgi:hypothetical protein